MARSIFKQKDRQEIDSRLAALNPAAPALFGKMNAARMICHMTDALEVATGAKPARAKKTFLSNPILRRVVIYYLPWPKGKAETVPEMLITKPSDWDADLARLRDLLHAAAARGASAHWAVHPAFGAISGKDYGTLIYRHFDHHLRQFGV
jgi:hypothetical protein